MKGHTRAWGDKPQPSAAPPPTFWSCPPHLWPASACAWLPTPHGADPPSVGTWLPLGAQGGNTPLIWATYSGSLDVIRFLLERGADTQVTYKKGWTPLHIAAREGRLEVARLLLEGGGDVKSKNDNGKTPLDLAMNDAMRKLLRRTPAEFAKEAEEMRRKRAEFAAGGATASPGTPSASSAAPGDKDRAALAAEDEAARRASDERRRKLAEEQAAAARKAALSSAAAEAKQGGSDSMPSTPDTQRKAQLAAEEEARWAAFAAAEERRRVNASSGDSASVDGDSEARAPAAGGSEARAAAAAEEQRRIKAEREEEESRRAGEALERMRKAAEEKRRKFAKDEEERRKQAAEENEKTAVDEERDSSRVRQVAAQAEQSAAIEEQARREAAEAEAARKRKTAAAEEARRQRMEAEESASAAAAAATATAAAAQQQRLADRSAQSQAEAKADAERRRAQAEAAAAAAAAEAAARAQAAAAAAAARLNPTYDPVSSKVQRTPEAEDEMRKAAEDLDLVLRSCRLDDAAAAVAQILSVEAGRTCVLALKSEWETALVEALGPTRGRADIRIMQLAALRALVASFTPVLGTQRAEPVKQGLRTLAALLGAAEEEESRVQSATAEKQRHAAEEAARAAALAAEEERRRAAQAAAEQRRKEAEEEERRARAAEEAERSAQLVSAADAHDARAAALEALAPAADAVRARLGLYHAGRGVAQLLAMLRTLPAAKTAGEEMAWFAEGVQATNAACDASGRQLAALRDAVRRTVEAGAPEYEVALAAAERDRAEEAHRASLAEAGRLLRELCGRQRARASATHEVLAHIGGVNAAVGGPDVAPVTHGDTYKDLAGATVGVAQISKELASRLLPAEQRTQQVAAQLLECLVEEASILEALEGPVEEAMGAAARAAAMVGGGLAAETPDADASVAEHLAAQREAELDRLRALEEERALAAAARDALARAKQSRDEAWVELEDLKHERKKAVQLQRPYTAQQEEEYVGAVSAIRQRVASIEADISRQEAFLRSAAVRECFPELAREAGSTRLAVPLFGPGSSAEAAEVGRFSSRHQFEEVKTLRLTPGSIVTRVKEVDKPEAPDHVLKEYSDADASCVAELRRLCGLRHPLIAPLEGAWPEDGSAYCVTPFFRGGALRPWFDDLKERRGALRAADWAQVRRAFKQLLQALAHAHGRGISHRDVKPENVFWQDDGRLALSDFGVTAVLARKLDASKIASSSAAGSGSTLVTPVAGYAAPEACGLNWNEALWTGAGDVWSVGVMALELITGELHAWEPTRRRLEAGPDKPLALAKASDRALQDFMALAAALTAEAPSDRPSAGEALCHAFFSAPEGTPSTVPAATKVQACQLLVGEALGLARKRLSNNLPGCEPYTLRCGLDTLVEDVLRGCLEAPEAALGAPWGAVLGGARAPLSEVMTRFFDAVGSPDSRFLDRAVSTAGGAPLYMPAETPTKMARSFEALALGRVLGKCLLEAIPVALEFAPMCYASLLGPAAEARALATPESALAHLACWDQHDAARLRALLLRRLGTGNDASLTVGSLLGNGDGTLLSDATKRDVLVRYCAKKLVERRRDALDAMARGFGAVLDAAGIGNALRGGVTPLELGALLFGSAYVDVEQLKRVLVWDAAWPVNEAQVPWLADALGRLTEPAVRVLLHRATGRLQMRPDGGDAPILVLRSPSLAADGSAAPGDDGAEVPRFPGGHVIQLPGECMSYAVFELRLRTALQLHGDYTTVHRLGLGIGDVAARRLVRLMAPAQGVTKVFECPNTHLFALGPLPGGVPTPPEAQGRCPECGALASAAGGPAKSRPGSVVGGGSAAGSILGMAMSPKYGGSGGASVMAPGSPAGMRGGGLSGYASPLMGGARRMSGEKPASGYDY